MRVLILATRISGQDGVTLETKNWKKIFESMGHKVTLVAGALDVGGVLIPELHFQSPEAVDLYEKVVYGKNNYKQVESEIFTQAGKIEGKLRTLLRKKKPDLLYIPNVLSLPMHFAFAVAIARVLEELKIPTIARHHDFWWERSRFRYSSMFPFWKRFFPPLLPNIKHVVINSIAKEKFEKVTGISPFVIWDSVDFKSKLNKSDSYSRHLKKDLGISKEDTVFLQATRIVPRKRIEISINLIEALNDKNAVLLIAGKAGDEGIEYEKYLKKLAKGNDIKVKFIGDIVNSRRRIVEYKDQKGNTTKKRIYTLWDCYNISDFVLYPTKLEGFGNQFVESVYFKKPLILTPYKVYKKDIKPLGFQTIEMPTKPNDRFIKKLKKAMKDKQKLKNMVEENFKLGEKYLSYEWVRQKLQKNKLLS